MTETPRPSLALVEAVHRHETCLLHATDNQLRDPVPAVDLVRRRGIGVHKYDPNLAAITRVDQTRRVQAGDAVSRGEPAPRKHEARIPVRNAYGDSSGYRAASSPWSENSADPGDQVAPGVSKPGVARNRQLRVHANERNFEHACAP